MNVGLLRRQNIDSMYYCNEIYVYSLVNARFNLIPCETYFTNLNIPFY